MILIWVPSALPRGNTSTFAEKNPSAASSNTCNRHSYRTFGGHFQQLPVLLDDSCRSCKRTSRLEQILFKNWRVNHVPMRNEYVILFWILSEMQSPYLCLLVLHPKYKLTYFQSKKWPQEWIDAARTVLREQWSTNYKPSSSDEPATQSSTSSVSCKLYDIH